MGEMYKLIGADSNGRFVFKDIAADKLDEMMGSDDNIAYLDQENYNKLRYAVREEIRVLASELRAHLESLADAARQHWEEHGFEDYFEMELVRSEDFLERLSRNAVQNSEGGMPK